MLALPRGRADRRPADVALLSAVSMCFALGAATRSSSSSTWPPPRPGRWPGSRCCRGCGRCGRTLAAIADAADPLAVQAMFAAAMLAADPVTSGVYYVDDHFVPYTGAKPVAKGWNNKRGRAERGRADTHVTAHDGRAVCFVTGEPSGLIRHAAQGAGGAEEGRRARRADHARLRPRRGVPAGVPALPRAGRALGHLPAGAAGGPGDAAGHHHGHRRRPDPADRLGRGDSRSIKDYGEARQITLFEHGKVALQILTSDFDACPADILAWLKSRWREENFLKYASGELRDRQDLRLPRQHRDEHQDRGQPGPQGGQRRRPRGGEGAGRRRAGPGRAARRPGHHPRRQEHQADPRRAGENHRAPARHWPPPPPPASTIPAKLPANDIDPEARTALLRTGRRGLQMVLRLLAHNAEHWLSSQPQRLPARRRRIPRHHPRDHHPRPGRHHHLHPRRDHRPPRTARAPPASPAPSPCSSTRSTPPRPPCPATPAPSPTTSPRKPGI